MEQLLDTLGTAKIRNHGINLTVPVRIDSTALWTNMGWVAIEVNGDGGILAAGTIQHHGVSPLCGLGSFIQIRPAD